MAFKLSPATLQEPRIMYYATPTENLFDDESDKQHYRNVIIIKIAFLKAYAPSTTGGLWSTIKVSIRHKNM